MHSGTWTMVKTAVGILWSVGERLRMVYSSADNEAVRRRDWRRTTLCVGVFAVSCVALVVIDSYGDAFTAVRSVTAKVRALGSRGGGSSSTTTTTGAVEGGVLSPSAVSPAPMPAA